MRARVQAIASLHSSWWRVIVAPGIGIVDGGIPMDFQEEWMPEYARFPNSEFWIDGYINGVPQVVERAQVQLS